MKSINTRGEAVKVRRTASRASNVQDEEVKNPTKLAEILRGIMRRLSDIESFAEYETTEFEKNVGSGGADVYLYHGFGKPVRYWVTYWTRQVGVAAPTTGPELVAQSDSNDNELHLKSYVAGRAVIRVEPVDIGIER